MRVVTLLRRSGRGAFSKPLRVQFKILRVQVTTQIQRLLINRTDAVPGPLIRGNSVALAPPARAIFYFGATLPIIQP